MKVSSALDEQRQGLAGRILEGRKEVTVLSAMWPAQPDELIRAILLRAREENIRLRLIVGDLSGAFEFLDDEARADLGNRIEVVPLAGGIPKGLGSRIDPFPGPLAAAAAALASNELSFDVFVARVHTSGCDLESDETVQLGGMVGYTPEALEIASKLKRMVVFEVVPKAAAPSSPTYPLSLAGNSLADTEYQPPNPIRSGQLSPQQDAIARHIAELIPAGAVLQLGLGSIPEGVTPYLAQRHEIRMHSGILPASAAEYLSGSSAHHVAIGVMPGSNCSWGISVSLGSISQLHAPRVLGAIDNFWAVNSALEVDLLARVNAEYAGGMRVAMGGGQADFVHASHASPGGGSIIALPSRTGSGHPRIVPTIPTPSTAFPADVDFIVTEYGVARLAGLTQRARAQSIIAVAHPDDRADLQMFLTDHFS